MNESRGVPAPIDQWVALIWATPHADALLGWIARVSNPANQANDKVEGLINYMIRNQHWSPFEMVGACIEINTTRDIGRQILRHRSFFFQEFSQRYQSLDALPAAPLREARMQDTKNRQNSLPCDDDMLRHQWEAKQVQAQEVAMHAYQWALQHGIAKEQARVVLPEGLTPSRMYMHGNLRSWITYLQVRMDPSTQQEHREIAEQVLKVLRRVAPITMNAVFGEADDE